MADLKTKDLAQRLSHRCFSTSFMKFRGPEALKGRWDEKAGLRGMRYAPNGSTRSRAQRKGDRL